MRGMVIFAAGFAAGVVFLAALFIGAHSLQTTKAAGAPSAPPLPRIIPTPPAPGLRQVPPAPPSRLQIPVQGVTAGELRDDFQEMRNGHRHEALGIIAPRGTLVLAADEGNVVKCSGAKRAV